MSKNFQNYMTLGDAKAYLDRAMTEPGFKLDPKIFLASPSVFACAVDSLVESHTIASGYGRRLLKMLETQGCDTNSLELLQYPNEK